MKPRPHVHFLWRPTGLSSLLVLVTATFLSQPGAIASAAAPTPWQLVQRPWSDSVPVSDIAAAGPSFLAAAGAQGRVAVSLTRGASWILRSPATQGFVADLLGVAFSDATQGVVVGAEGTLLVTSDGGSTWNEPTIVGRAPAVALNDVAAAGLRAVAVGDGGAALESADGGATWRTLDVPTAAALSCVAVVEDGMVVVGADDGSVLVRHGGTWSATTVYGPVMSVAIRLSPSGGSSNMRIVASNGWEVAGSDDGVGFSTLLSASYASAALWPSLAWSYVPQDELLIAGPGGDASFYSVTTPTLIPGADALGDPRAVTTTPAQSVAYVLGTDGRIARTLSSGRTPATLTPVAKTITAGQRVALRSTVSIAAPGELVVQRRVGGGVWRTLRSLAWTASDWQRPLDLGVSPVLSSEYRLRFTSEGVGPVVSPTRRVIVGPRLKPDKTRIVVSRGQAYRFTGTVYPTLRGESVRLYTDRAGKWHQIDMGGVVKLREGRRWTSRLFGTPARETYHLRARIGATARHGASWSPIVTVVVR